MTDQGDLFPAMPASAAPVHPVIPGQAHYAGSGPQGATCSECAHWAFEGEYIGPRKGQLRAAPCARYRELTCTTGPRVSPDAPACREFAPTSEVRPRSRQEVNFRIINPITREDGSLPYFKLDEALRRIYLYVDQGDPVRTIVDNRGHHYTVHDFAFWAEGQSFFTTESGLLIPGAAVIFKLDQFDAPATPCGVITPVWLPDRAAVDAAIAAGIVERPRSGSWTWPEPPPDYVRGRLGHLEHLVAAMRKSWLGDSGVWK